MSMGGGGVYTCPNCKRQHANWLDVEGTIYLDCGYCHAKIPADWSDFIGMKHDHRALRPDEDPYAEGFI